jgi:hypothetical protein
MVASCEGGLNSASSYDAKERLLLSSPSQQGKFRATLNGARDEGSEAVMNGTGAGTKTQRELTLPSVDLNRSDEVAHFGSLGHRCSVALALHLWTGWPIYLLSDCRNPDATFSHAAVKSPKGFLDIRGLGNSEGWERIIEVRTASDWQFF